MSQEDPTIVVSPDFEKSYVGGSAVVAAHAAKLGAKVTKEIEKNLLEEAIYNHENATNSNEEE